MLNLCLTRFESVYLVAQIIWSTQGIKGITDATHDLANKMSDQISNELHNYYLQKRLVNEVAIQFLRRCVMTRKRSRAIVDQGGEVTR
uniref:NR LBD domain-containing protein n=1 Tax=Acrobeloides nanus TaxID=290746 RepID=A0A914DA05_9BILA